jgi:L-threonate 2-dehydrogenase
MYPKAYRWVAEMREIAAFLSEDKAAAMIFEGAAQLCDRLAADIANEGQEQSTLDEFLRSK